MQHCVDDNSKAWEQQALTHWDLINRLAVRRFPQSALAEEAALFVLDRLADNRWERLRDFEGRSSLATYIGSVTIRLLEDFARKRFGRINPPLWIRRLGGIWLTLFRLLCLERYSPGEAVAMITQQQASAAVVVERAAYQLLGELPSCGEIRGEQVDMETADRIRSEAATASPQEQRFEEEERHKLYAALGRLLFDEETAGAGAHFHALCQISTDMDSRDRLLLKMCYRDGLAVAEAGRMLGLNRFQAHGRLRRLLQLLRQSLDQTRLAEELRLLLRD